MIDMIAKSHVFCFSLIQNTLFGTLRLLLLLLLSRALLTVHLVGHHSIGLSLVLLLRSLMLELSAANVACVRALAMLPVLSE